MEKLTKDEFVKAVIMRQAQKKKKYDSDYIGYNIESKHRMQRRYDGRNLRNGRVQGG